MGLKLGVESLFMTPAALHQTEYNCDVWEGKIRLAYSEVLFGTRALFLGLALKAETDSGQCIYWAASVISGDNFIIKIGVNASVPHFGCALASSTIC